MKFLILLIIRNNKNVVDLYWEDFFKKSLRKYLRENIFKNTMTEILCKNFDDISRNMNINVNFKVTLKLMMKKKFIKQKK